MNPFSQLALLGVLESLSHCDGKEIKCGMLQRGERAASLTGPIRDPHLCTLFEVTLFLFPCSNAWAHLQTLLGLGGSCRLQTEVPSTEITPFPFRWFLERLEKIIYRREPRSLVKISL